MVQLPGRGGWGKRVTCHQTKITETDKPRVARGLKGLGDNGIVNKPMRVRIGNTEKQRGDNPAQSPRATVVSHMRIYT